MTLVQAGEIFRYWEQEPPTHLMLRVIASLLGWRPLHAGDCASSLDELAAAAPPGLAVAEGSGNVAMAAPLGLEAMRAKNRAWAVASARRNSC